MTEASKTVLGALRSSDTMPWYGITIAYDRMSLKSKKMWTALLVCGAVVCHLVFAVGLGWI